MAREIKRNCDRFETAQEALEAFGREQRGMAEEAYDNACRSCGVPPDTESRNWYVEGWFQGWIFSPVRN